MKQYVVTGGAGFIGSNIVRVLVRDGHQVTVFDDLSSGHKSNLDDIQNDIRFVQASMLDSVAVAKVMQNQDGVFHEAAVASVQKSIKDVKTTFEINVMGMLNVLIAARDAAVERVVFAASAAAYGNNPEPKKNETILPEPVSPYGVAKVTGEHLLRSFSECFGMSTVALRYFNVFGPYQDPDSEYSAVIPLFVKAMLAGKSPTIFGDGMQSRDFTYVDNVVQGNILAMNSKKQLQGDVINMATDASVSLLDLIQAINEVLGMSIEPHFEPARIGDIRHSQADITKARALLGYEPEYNFVSGLQHTLEYYKKLFAQS